jgi:hypothetical protein
MFRWAIAKMASATPEYIGATEFCYLSRELLQERQHLGRVWLAMSDILRYLDTLVLELIPYRPGQNKYILKDITKDSHRYCYITRPTNCPSW